MGQTQDSRSARPGFESLPCNLLVTEPGPSHSSGPRPLLGNGSNSTAFTVRLTDLPGAAGEDDFKAIKRSIRQVLLSLSFLLGH